MLDWFLWVHCCTALKQYFNSKLQLTFLSFRFEYNWIGRKQHLELNCNWKYLFERILTKNFDQQAYIYQFINHIILSRIERMKVLLDLALKPNSQTLFCACSYMRTYLLLCRFEDLSWMQKNYLIRLICRRFNVMNQVFNYFQPVDFYMCKN